MLSEDHPNGPVPEDHPHYNRWVAARDWWVEQAELEIADRLTAVGDFEARYPIEITAVQEGRRRTNTATFIHGEGLMVSAGRVDRRRCANCDQTFDRALRACARCKVVYYCSRECQRADWRSHKNVCRDPMDSLRQRHE